jgi:hypothetical protein
MIILDSVRVKNLLNVQYNVINLTNWKYSQHFFYHEAHEGHEEKTKECLSQRKERIINRSARKKRKYYYQGTEKGSFYYLASRRDRIFNLCAFARGLVF